jgi:hypothetical protein
MTKSGLGFLAGAVLWTLSFAAAVGAQSARTIDAGTTITVRTNEAINANSSDGRIFSGVVDQDVVNRGGSVAIPRGSNVELLVRTMSKNQVELDLDSVTTQSSLGRRRASERTGAPVNSWAAAQ